MVANRDMNNAENDKTLKSKVRAKVNDIRYTVEHRKAFRKVYKQLTGRLTLSAWLHDMDKVILKLFMDGDKVSKLHRSYSRHHEAKARTHDDFVNMIVDFECARLTKPDKPLNARQTVDKWYPHMKDKLLPIIEELGL